MKSLKFYKILSLVLVILNIATLAFFYFSKPPHPPKPGEARLATEIGLTGEKKKKIDALEIKHHTEKKKLMDEDYRLHEKLFKEISNPAEADELLTKINTNRAQIEKITFDFFSAVAAECDDKQLKTLDEIIGKSLRMITGRPPKPK